MAMPSMSECGSPSSTERSMNAPGSPSSALQRMYLTRCPAAGRSATSCRREAGAAAAAQAAGRTSSTTSSGVMAVSTLASA